MEFQTNMFSVFEKPKKTIDLTFAKLPNNKDVFFMAKKQELYEHYQAARSFMAETDTEDWDHWFDDTGNEENNKYVRLFLRSTFYESALFYYNAIVDISWTLCYVAIEFACNCNSRRESLDGVKPIEEAYKLLRSAESNVTSPTAETNPFEYLKKMSPKFEPIIDFIVDFWEKFAPSSTRTIYNYCKHRGKPEYEEIAELRPVRFLGYYIEQKESQERVQLVSDVQDVRYVISLNNAINDLRDFDDKLLFPYIKELIERLTEILKPSPFL